MQQSIIRTAFLCMAALLLGGGCSKSFLDQQVPGGLDQNQFYQTDQDALQATTAVYDLLQAHYNFGWWASIYLVKTFPSDESNAGGSNEGDQPAYQALDRFTYNDQNQAILGAWRMCYFDIYRANQVINRVKPETPLRKRLVAECKALRAYNYLELVSLWGDVPLVLRDITQEEYTKTPRAPKADVYAQIEKDLQEAIPELPLKSAYGAADKYRMSKGTAQSLLGKALLYQEKWAEAAKQFDDVIASGQYGLEADFGRVFSRQGELGTESVFEVQYTDKVGYDWGNFPWNPGRTQESNIHIQLMGPRADYYKKAPGDSLLAGWGFNLPKPALYRAFVTAGDTERRKNTVMSLEELRAAGGDWTTTSSWQFEGYFQRKYGSFSGQTNGENGAIPELNYGTNWRIIRYADVLLMAAEAYYRAGNAGRALTELNNVRRRAHLGDINAGGNALFEAIVTERQLELAFEGARFVDLVRWGRAEQALGPLGFKKGTHELLPIPNEDVKIAGLTQNNGY